MLVELAAARMGRHVERKKFSTSGQAGAEHFRQCAEFLPLRNRGLGPLAVTYPLNPGRCRSATEAGTRGMNK